MENRIPRDNAYKDIKISELGFRELTDKEDILVERFKKKIIVPIICFPSWELFLVVYLLLLLFIM